MSQRRVLGFVGLSVLIVAMGVFAVAQVRRSASGESSLAVQPGNRFVVTATAAHGPTVDAAINRLKTNGFRQIAPADLAQAVGAATRSVVLTADAFRAASPGTLRALYTQGTVVAALDVSIPELRGVLEPDPFVSGGRVEGWLTPTPTRTIYSLIRKTPRGSYRERSDSLWRPQILYDALVRTEQPPQYPPQGTPTRPPGR